MSGALIFSAHYSNISALHLIENGPCILEDILSLNLSRLLDPGGIAIAILPHLVLQWFMGMLFAYIHLGPRVKILQNLLPFCFLMPLLLAMLPLPTAVLKHTPAFSAILPLVLVIISVYTTLVDIVKRFDSGFLYAKNFAENYGLSALLENEWQRLNVPCVLRTF